MENINSINSEKLGEKLFKWILSVQNSLKNLKEKQFEFDYRWDKYKVILRSDSNYLHNAWSIDLINTDIWSGISFCQMPGTRDKYTVNYDNEEILTLDCWKWYIYQIKEGKLQNVENFMEALNILVSKWNWPIYQTIWQEYAKEHLNNFR